MMVLTSQTEKGSAEFSKFILILCAFLMGSCVKPDVKGDFKRPPQVHEVEIKKFQFKPATLTIQKGDLVRWVNRDIVPHRVADANRNKWHSHDMGAKDSFSQPIRVSTSYICVLHPGMKANIVVQVD